MGCKLFVALQLDVAHQFIERFAGGRTRGFEPPATFGATKTPKALLLNPYQVPAHGRLCRCAPNEYPIAVKGRNVLGSPLTAFSPPAYCLTPAENRRPSQGAAGDA